MGLGHGQDPHSKRSGGRLADPRGQGTPCRVPNQPLSTVLLDVSPCMEGKTTLKSNETKSATCESKIAWQRLQNRLDPTSVLREKPRKPKDAQRKARTDATRGGP